MNFFVMGTTSLDVGKLLVVVGCAVGSVGANGGEAGHFGDCFGLSGFFGRSLLGYFWLF